MFLRPDVRWKKVEKESMKRNEVQLNSGAEKTVEMKKKKSNKCRKKMEIKNMQ